MRILRWRKHLVRHHGISRQSPLKVIIDLPNKPVVVVSKETREINLIQLALTYIDVIYVMRVK